MTFDEEMKIFVDERVGDLKKGAGMKHAQLNPLAPQQMKDREILYIKDEVAKLKLVHERIVPYIKKLKGSIPDITEQTEICATYLIYGKVSQTFDAIFLLSIGGFNFEMMELSRSINENLDLIKLFHIEKDHKNLISWFEGKIIDNKISREAQHEYLLEGNDNVESLASGEINPYELITKIYRVISKYTHCSYGALLDSVDVFSHDFDWNKYGGFHYTLDNMHQIESTMTATIITLKMTYQKLGFHKEFAELTQILNDFAGAMNANTLAELLSKRRQSPT
jgi:hypothetical protein